MPTRGALSDSGTKIRDYVRYVVNQQRFMPAALLVVTLGMFADKLVSAFITPGDFRLVLVLLFVIVAAWEIYEQFHRYRFAGSKGVKHLDKIQIGPDTNLPLDQIKPSRLQSELGFVVHYAGTASIMASDSIDARLLKQDWRITQDVEKPKRVSSLVKRHRSHALGLLAFQMRKAMRTGALFNNDPKLCLADELGQLEVGCHEGGYFDSICTNEASMVTLEEKSRISHPFDNGPLYPIALEGNGYVLRDLHDADVNNHIGVSTLGITTDRCFVVWQQTNKNMEGAGVIVGTASGSVDYSDLTESSLHATLRRAIDRELGEEVRKRRLLAASDSSSLVASTQVIGFFRWLRRGGKPEFLALTRLSVDSTKLRPDGFEVSGISGLTPSGERISIHNVFAAKTLAEIPAAIADIRRLYEGCEHFQPLPVHVGLRRTLDIMETLVVREPGRLAEMLYGEPAT